MKDKEKEKLEVLDQIHTTIKYPVDDDYVLAIEKFNDCPNFILKVLEFEIDDGIDGYFRSLAFASKRLQNDKDFLLQAAQLLGKNSDAIVHCVKMSDNTKNKFANCKKTLMQFLKAGIYLFDHAPAEMRNNKEVALAAIKLSGSALKDASDKLRDDEDVVLAGASAKATNFKYASFRLKNDKNFILKCLRSCKGAILFYVTSKILSDKDFMKQAIKENNWVIQYANDDIRSDIELNYLAYKDNINEFKYASHSLQLKALTCLYENRDKY